MNTMSLFVEINEGILLDPRRLGPQRWLGPKGRDPQRYPDDFGDMHLCVVSLATSCLPRKAGNLPVHY